MLKPGLRKGIQKFKVIEHASAACRQPIGFSSLYQLFLLAQGSFFFFIIFLVGSSTYCEALVVALNVCQILSLYKKHKSFCSLSNNKVVFNFTPFILSVHCLLQKIALVCINLTYSFWLKYQSRGMVLYTLAIYPAHSCYIIDSFLELVFNYSNFELNF